MALHIVGDVVDTVAITRPDPLGFRCAITGPGVVVRCAMHGPGVVVRCATWPLGLGVVQFLLVIIRSTILIIVVVRYILQRNVCIRCAIRLLRVVIRSAIRLLLVGVRTSI